MTVPKTYLIPNLLLRPETSEKIIAVVKPTTSGATAVRADHTLVSVTPSDASVTLAPDPANPFVATVSCKPYAGSQVVAKIHTVGYDSNGESSATLRDATATWLPADIWLP